MVNHLRTWLANRKTSGESYWRIPLTFTIVSPLRKMVGLPPTELHLNVSVLNFYITFSLTTFRDALDVPSSFPPLSLPTNALPTDGKRCKFIFFIFYGNCWSILRHFIAFINRGTEKSSPTPGTGGQCSLVYQYSPRNLSSLASVNNTVYKYKFGESLWKRNHFLYY